MIDFKIIVFKNSQGVTLYRVIDPENWQFDYATLQSAMESIEEKIKTFSYVLEG